MLCASSLMAQDVLTPEDEAKKKDINQIKLSEMAVYSDVVQEATSEDEALSLAQEKSIQMMQTHVVEICAKRLHMDKKDVQEIWDVIDDKCQNIVVKKGDLFRVFTYIMKDALHLGPKKPNQNDIEEYFGEEARRETASIESKPKVDPNKVIEIDASPVSTKYEQDIDQALEAEKEENLKAEEEARQKAAADAKALAEAQAAAEAQAQAQAAAAKAEEEARLKAEAEAKALAEAQAAAAKAQEEAARVQAEAAKAKAEAEAKAKAAQASMPELCKTMLSKGDMSTLVSYLNEEKAKNTLMYGNRNTMQYAERCYVVIIDKSTRKIVTILDKGASDRTNLTTGLTDNLVNYRGGNYSAIFVQEY
jgi:septal ring factor EnvC (AmiA/AmiB activator)